MKLAIMFLVMLNGLHPGQRYFVFDLAKSKHTFAAIYFVDHGKCNAVVPIANPIYADSRGVIEFCTTSKSVILYSGEK